MSSLALNRILLILGVVGLYIAGVLSAEHIWHLAIPCTSGGGCETVARDPSSYVGPIAVAYIGFAGYLVLTALATTRLFTGDLLSKPLVGMGYLFSAIGMIASLYLQYISFTQIHATCAWCLTSAVVMVLTFVVYTVLYNKVGATENVEPVRSSKALFQGMAGVAIAVFAVGGTVYGKGKVAGPVQVIEGKEALARLVPEPKSQRNQLGPDDAPITIVEFADLCCPTCRRSFPKLHEMIAKYPGKIRVIYRHFPIDQLAGHEMSLPATIASELAARKDKFWDFAATFTSTGEEAPSTRDGVDKVASTVGITPEEITKAMEDPKSQAQINMLRDYADAIDVFQINGTPTYLITAKDMPIKKLTLVGLENELESPAMQNLMK